jgi:Tfp pilus assembly protein PilO
MITDVMNRITVVRAMILGMVLAAFYYFMMFDPGMAQQTQISNNTNRISDLQRTIEDNQKKLDRAAVYKKTASEIGSTINKLLSLVPEKFGMTDLMRIISNEAKVAGLSLSTVKPESTKISAMAPEFEELIATVDISGSFLQHMVFLSNLTKINQILITKKIEFQHQRDGRGDEPPTVGMKVEIVAFRYRGSGAAAAPKPGTPGAGGRGR